MYFCWYCWAFLNSLGYSYLFILPNIHVQIYQLKSFNAIVGYIPIVLFKPWDYGVVLQSSYIPTGLQFKPSWIIIPCILNWKVIFASLYVHASIYSEFSSLLQYIIIIQSCLHRDFAQIKAVSFTWDCCNSVVLHKC